LVAAGALDTTAPSSRGERTCDMMAAEILMPKLEVLRLLGRNVSFETTVRRFAVLKR
jgi:Zn-dependent peptidase ImmA (M78 family)